MGLTYIERKNEAENRAHGKAERAQMSVGALWGVEQDENSLQLHQ